MNIDSVGRGKEGERGLGGERRRGRERKREGGRGREREGGEWRGRGREIIESVLNFLRVVSECILFLRRFHAEALRGELP